MTVVLKEQKLHAMHMSTTAKTRYDMFLCPGIIFAHSTIFPHSISLLSKVVIPQGILEHPFLLCLSNGPKNTTQVWRDLNIGG